MTCWGVGWTEGWPGNLWRHRVLIWGPVFLMLFFGFGEQWRTGHSITTCQRSMTSLQNFSSTGNQQEASANQWRIKSAFNFNWKRSFASENDPKTLRVQTHFNLNRISKFEFALTHLWKFSAIEQILSPKKALFKALTRKVSSQLFQAVFMKSWKFWLSVSKVPHLQSLLTFPHCLQWRHLLAGPAYFISKLHLTLPRDK